MKHIKEFEHIDVLEAAEHLEELISSFAEGHDPYLLTKESEPQMVLLPYEIYEMFTAPTENAKSEADQERGETY